MPFERTELDSLPKKNVNDVSNVILIGDSFDGFGGKFDGFTKKICKLPKQLNSGNWLHFVAAQ